MNKINNERRDITTDTTEIYRAKRDYYDQLYMPTSQIIQRNEYISRNIQPTTTESKRNRKSVQINNKKLNQ